MQASDTIEQIVTEHRLNPVAVLLTHGHLDHSADAAAVADRHHAVCVIGAGDRAQLSDPLGALPQTMHSLLGEAIEAHPDEPASVLALDPEPGPRSWAGLDFTVLPAPGHTPGCTLYQLTLPPDPAAPPEAPGQVVFTGDVVFADSIGRTDLPGGDPQQMEHTLREIVLDLPDDVVVLPGHGPQSTIGRERGHNPFLVGLAPEPVPGHSG